MTTTMRMPTVMGAQQRFAQVPSVAIQRSVFDRSHGHKLTFDAGLVVPVYVDDVMPGDTFHCTMTAIVRLTTPLKPFMDNLYLDSFFFFVPYRLVWTNFVKFMGEQTNPADSIAYTVPVIIVPFTPAVSSVFDYMGVMTQGTATAIQTPNKISALPFRALNLIFNQWFRDENLQNSTTVPLTDGPDNDALYALFRRGKRHDYFTSSLPWTQKQTLGVTIPLGTTAPVYVGATATAIGVGIAGATSTPKLLNDVGASNIQATAVTGGSALLADLTNATAATINQLRQAFQIQKLLERDARGGTRYTEIVRAHFGVTSPDARLQRAEYLGGGSTPIVVSPIVQQTQTGLTGGTTPIGNLSATATGLVHGHGFHKSFTEHGVILGLVNVRADLTYQQGVERYWFKQTRYDFFWPEFAQIGEQAVLNQEIWFEGTTALNSQDVAAFGYQERYAEYRYKPSRISGLFRSNAAGTLHIWHLSEDFAALPTLGSSFIADPTTTVLGRVVATPAEPDFYGDFWFNLRCARPMPVYGVPGMIDHF